MSDQGCEDCVCKRTNKMTYTIFTEYVLFSLPGKYPGIIDHDTMKVSKQMILECAQLIKLKR